MLNILNCIIEKPFSISIAPYKYLESYACRDKVIKKNTWYFYLDCNETIQNLERIHEFVQKKKIDIVCFSCNIISIKSAVNIARGLKYKGDKCLLVFGGSVFADATVSRIFQQKHEEMDIIIKGEGEIPFAALLKAIISKEDIKNIRGLCIRHGGTIIDNGEADIIADLDDLPFPYTPGDLQAHKMLLYSAARGCVQKCNFCSWDYGPKRKGVRSFSLEKIKQELDKFFFAGISHLYIADSYFMRNKKDLMEILTFIRERNCGTDIYAYIHEKLLDEEIIRLLPGARVLTGLYIQSLNPETSKIAGRKAGSLKRFTDILSMFRKHRVSHFDIDLILGLPGDNYATYRSTIIKLLEILIFTKAHYDRIIMDPLKVVPGSNFYRNKEKYGIIAEINPPFCIKETTTFSREDVKRALVLTTIINLSFNHPREKHLFIAVAKKEKDVGSLVDRFLNWISHARPDIKTDEYPDYNLFRESERYCKPTLTRIEYNNFFNSL